MSSRPTRLTIWYPSTSNVERSHATNRDDSQGRSEQSGSTHGAVGTRSRLPQHPEYSPLHMRLLNCPGGTCPSMAMCLEMELEYAERRAKCLRRSQCHTAPRASADVPARRGEGSLLSGSSPFSDPESITVRHNRHSVLQRTSTSIVTSRQKSPPLIDGKLPRAEAPKSRFLTSSDAISDDVSTCAGTGSLQSVIGPASSMITNARSVSKVHHELLPLTRSCRRRQCVPKPRARPAKRSDRLCPPSAKLSPSRLTGALKYPIRHIDSPYHQSSSLRHRTCSPIRGHAGGPSVSRKFAACRLYSPGRDLPVGVTYSPTYSEPRATLRVTRTTRHAIQPPAPTPTRLRRTSCVPMADPLSHIHSLWKAQGTAAPCTPPGTQRWHRQLSGRSGATEILSIRRQDSSPCSRDYKSLKRQGSSQCTTHYPHSWGRRESLSQRAAAELQPSDLLSGKGPKVAYHELHIASPSVPQDDSDDERRQRVRRFKSCTSVGILKNLVRRHARKLAGGRSGSHEAERSGGVETEAESVISAAPQYNSTMSNLARLHTSQDHLIHRSTESASSRLFMTCGATEASNFAIPDYSGNRMISSTKPFNAPYTRYKSCRPIDTDSEDDDYDEDDVEDDDE